MPSVSEAQVISCVAHVTQAVIMQTKQSSPTSRRVRGDLSSGLSCGLQFGVELRRERQFCIGELARNRAKSAGVWCVGDR